MSERTATVAAAVLLAVALLLGVAVASGALTRSAPTPVRAQAGTSGPQGPDTYFVGRAGCDDGGDPARARNAASPWCTLQHAVAATPAGGTIAVQAGDYDGVVERGARRLGLVVRAADPGHPPRVGRVALRGSSGLRLERLVFAGGVTLNAVDDVTVADGDFPGTSFYARSGHGVKVVRSHFHGLRGAARAILFQGSPRPGARTTQDALVEANRIDDLDHDAIDVYNGYRRVTITGNAISDVHQPGGVSFHADAVQLQGGEDLRLLDNRIERATHGIILKDGGPTRHALIQGNVVSDVSGAALQVYNGPGTRIVRNTFVRNLLGVVLGNVRSAPGRTRASLVANVLQGVKLSEGGEVGSARGNLFAAGRRYGSRAYRGRPVFRDPRAGDFRLASRQRIAGVPSGAAAPGTRLGPRP